MEYTNNKLVFDYSYTYLCICIMQIHKYEYTNRQIWIRGYKYEFPDMNAQVYSNFEYWIYELILGHKYLNYSNFAIIIIQNSGASKLIAHCGPSPHSTHTHDLSKTATLNQEYFNYSWRLLGWTTNVQMLSNYDSSYRYTLHTHRRTLCPIANHIFSIFE